MKIAFNLPRFTRLCTVCNQERPHAYLTTNFYMRFKCECTAVQFVAKQPELNKAKELHENDTSN